MSPAMPKGTVIVIGRDPMAAARVEAALRDLTGWRVEVSRPARLRDDREDDPRVVMVLIGSSAEVRRDLSGMRRTAAVIALSGDPAALWTSRARALGVRAVLPLGASAPELIAAVRAVHAGLFVCHREALAAPALAAVAGTPLTSREREILEMMAEGASNRLIAARLAISRHTVKFHVASVLAKLDAGSRTEAVALALRAGLLAV